LSDWTSGPLDYLVTGHVETPLRLPSRLYAIVDNEVCAGVALAPDEVVRAFLSAGARLIQLRCKDLPSGAFLDLANRILEDTRAAGATLIINDRADVAALSGAHGLHVGQEDLSPADARAVIGASAVLGLSTHTREQWLAAVREPISYMAIGPAFATGTKETGYGAVGLDVIREASATAAAQGLPTVAIGGITIDNAAAVIETGAAAVAVISDLLKGDPEDRCRAFLRTLQ
jgi:thiamine-phosphate pyrophosphorylase